MDRIIRDIRKGSDEDKLCKLHAFLIFISKGKKLDNLKVFSLEMALLSPSLQSWTYLYTELFEMSKQYADELGLKRGEKKKIKL